jgi:hypothetical protein
LNAPTTTKATDPENAIKHLNSNRRVAYRVFAFKDFVFAPG